MQKIRLNLFMHEKTNATKHAIRTNNAYPVNAVHYIISGQGYFNGKLLKKGDGFVCLKNDTVEYFPDKNDPWEYFWARLDGDILDADNCFFDANTHTFRFTPDERFFATAKFIFENQNACATNALFSGACASLLFSGHILSHCSKERDFQSRLHVNMAKNYIDSNYYHPLSIDEVANHLHLSRAYLRNIFYRLEQKSPQQYLIGVRIERAKALLKTKNATISEIAASVGYQDPIQFYKIFKKHTGISATQYQKDSLYTEH